MGDSARREWDPKGWWRRCAGLIAWAVVLVVVVVLDAVWLVSLDRPPLGSAFVAVVGLIGVLVLAVFLQYVWGRYSTRRLRGISDIHAATDLPVLGVVPFRHSKDADRVAVTANGSTYGMVAAQLAETLRETGRDRLLITSPTPGDGRTTTAVNLATMLTAEDLRVALVSADPNGEGVDEVLGLDRRPGLTEILGGRSSLESALQPYGIDGVSVLTAGGPSDEVLGRYLDKLSGVLDRLSRTFDVIVIDAPAVLGGLETVLLAQDADQVLLVIDVRHGKRSEATAALAYLGHVRDRLVGCIANDPGRRRSRRTPAASTPASVAGGPGETAGLLAAGVGLGELLRRVAGRATSAAGAVPRAARRVGRAARDKVRSLGRHGTARRRRWIGVITAAAVAALVIPAGWWLSDDEDRSEPGRERALGRDNAAVAGIASSGRAAADAAVKECQSTWDAQTQPLHAAASSLSQWQLHIKAMNQLVAGKISLDQAQAFWERTRVRAAQRVRRFQRADATYTVGQYSCPTLVTSENPGPRLTAVSACRRDVAQRDDVLRAARVAVDTWHHHVMDMNMLRNHTMSPARAIRRWNKHWKQGVAELHHYHKQLRQTDNQHC
jgi:Mrp family chromosome partitioning ATPase